MQISGVNPQITRGLAQVRESILNIFDHDTDSLGHVA
jgi:hypothetical protein